MKVPFEMADGQTDCAPLIFDLMVRGEFEGIEGCTTPERFREIVLICMIQRCPLTLTRHPADPWPERPKEEPNA